MAIRTPRWLVAVFLSLASLPLVYLLLTLPIAYPDSWDQAEEGLSRAEVNAVLNPHDWQKENGAYLIFHSKGLRTWYIDVEFEDDICTAITIFHEDFHDKAINEFLRFCVYLRAALTP